MMLRVAAAIVGCLAAGCLAMRLEGGALRFAEEFEAIQVLRIEGDSAGTAPSKEFLVSVKRKGGDLRLVFLEPFWQQALIEISYQAGGYSVTPLVQGISLPVRGEEIADAAREVFAWTGRLDRNGSAQFKVRAFRVRIAEVRGEGSCILPRRIELVPRVAGSPRLIVTTEEWRCP